MSQLRKHCTPENLGKYCIVSNLFGDDEDSKDDEEYVAAGTDIYDTFEDASDYADKLGYAYPNAYVDVYEITQSDIDRLKEPGT